MPDEIYRLYQETLPLIKRNAAAVRGIIADAANHIIREYADGRLVGVSIVNENTIYLLCVDEAHRRRGIGSRLLQSSEDYVRAAGHRRIVVGAGQAYIMPGIPTIDGADLFFKRRGYVYMREHGDSLCLDMDMAIRDFVDDGLEIGAVIAGIRYRFAVAADMAAIEECMLDAAENFVPFYRKAHFYEGKATPAVLIAEKDGLVLGAVMVGIENAGGGDHGSIGCTATREAYRGRGIGTTMVRLATKHLRDIGADYAFIGFTNTDIMSIYAKSGYKICMEYFAAEKKLG